MGFIQDLADGFSGKGARRDIQAGKAEATGQINQGLQDALPDYARAGSRFDPVADAASSYNQAGTGFSKRYADSMGINGVEAQRGVQSEYMNDPIQNFLMDRIQRANTRAAVAGGMNNSGAATQSLTNSLLQNWGQYQEGLRGGATSIGAMGLSGGVQAAAGQSGADQMAGDARISTANQAAGITTGATNAIAATRAAPMNNLLNIASIGVQAATGKPATRYGTS